HVARGDVQAAGEIRVEGEEAAERAVDRVAGFAVEDGDVRPAAGAGRGNDVEDAVAVHVVDGDADATGEARVVGEEVEQERARGGVEDLDVRAAAGVGRR